VNLWINFLLSEPGVLFINLKKNHTMVKKMLFFLVELKQMYLFLQN